MNNIRNFSIIAHIDHGKSTLADRLLQTTGTITKREMKFNQVLDDMELEQERGITIKLHAITMKYKSQSGKNFTFNLIDTPGHVDFTYEVSRSIAACEGAILVVDASQGVEAQTISNLFLAIDAGLEIIPVINKIDLPHAMIDNVKQQIKDLIGCKDEDIILASAKANIGIENILEAIVNKIPEPKGKIDSPTRALIFDSLFDPYRGAIAYIRVVDGELNEGDKVAFHFSGKSFVAEEIGILEMQRKRTGKISAGEVGYLICGIKDLHEIKVGDTIMRTEQLATFPLPGYKEVKPMVFAGLFPTNTENFEYLRDSLAKLHMNDASLTYEPETSTALGFGFRCGFLGLLHMEIIQERLEREYQQNLITTVPNVEYKVITKTKSIVLVDNPALMPQVGNIEYVEEPYVASQIITPSEYIGNIMKLTMDRRGIFKNTTYLDSTRVEMKFELPLSEIIFDFYDKLKSTTRGYASFDYEFIEFRESDLVKLDILLNTEIVDALSTIVHREKSYEWGKKICERLKQLIPKQMFEIAIQSAIGNKIIARSTISAM